MPGLAEIVQVQNEVWNENHDWLERALAREIRSSPPDVQVLIARSDGKPVASSWMRVHPGTHFASAWGAATLAAYRGRSIYRTLLARHRDAAWGHGVRYIYVDANGNSRPALEKAGFRRLTGARAFVWSCESAASSESDPV